MDVDILVEDSVTEVDDKMTHFDTIRHLTDADSLVVVDYKDFGKINANHDGRMMLILQHMDGVRNRFGGVDTERYLSKIFGYTVVRDRDRDTVFAECRHLLRIRLDG